MRNGSRMITAASIHLQGAVETGVERRFGGVECRECNGWRGNESPRSLYERRQAVPSLRSEEAMLRAVSPVWPAVPKQRAGRAFRLDLCR